MVTPVQVGTDLTDRQVTACVADVPGLPTIVEPSIDLARFAVSIGNVMLALLSFITRAAEEAAPREGSLGAKVDEFVRDFFPAIWQWLQATLDNVLHNGYQTGVAVLAGAIAAVVLLSQESLKKEFAVPIGLGGFWGGWLMYNSVMGTSYPLFPGDDPTLKIWDVALKSGMIFLFAAMIVAVALLTLWVRVAKPPVKVLMTVGCVLGASVLFNMYQSLSATW